MTEHTPDLLEALREIASQMHNLPRSATADRVEAICRAALSRTVLNLSQRETGWLIESKDASGRPRWWGEHNEDGLCDWTFDSLKAIRFCRKVDAERAIAMAEWIDVMREECVATDHAWLDPKAEGDGQHRGTGAKPSAAEPQNKPETT